MKPEKKRVILSCLLIIILGLIVYANSLNGKFLWDDKALIIDNVCVKSLSNLPKILTKNIETYTGKTYHFYRPIHILTYILDYSLWKFDVRGYHLTNILLHILVALSIYWLINIIFADRMLSLVASIFFVIHPIHTEAVSYISGRADPLSLLFMIISFIFYIKYLDLKDSDFYLLMLLSFILALLSRENSVILPILLLLYHYSFSSSGGKRKLEAVSILSIIGMDIIYIILRVTALRQFLPGANLLVTTTFFQRLPGFFVAITNYIRLLLWPAQLHMEYGDRLFKFSEPAAILGFFIFVFLLSSAFKRRKTSKIIFFSILWFLITLLPVSNLYPVSAYMAEHWLYLPSIGFFLILAKILSSICKNKHLKILGLLIVVILIGFYSYLTINQNNYWKEPIPFYERTLGYAPDSLRVNNDLAIAYNEAGRDEDAIPLYKKIIELAPDRPDTYVNLAALYINIGKTEEAVLLCKKAIELEPINATAHNNLAVAYYSLGNYDLAIEHCDKAIELGYRVKPKLLELLKPYR